MSSGNNGKTPMDAAAAARIQADADKNSHNQEFKQTAQAAAAKNENAKQGGGNQQKK